jgi:hypothetical protein
LTEPDSKPAAAQLVNGVTYAGVEREFSSRADMVSRFFNTAAFVPANLVPRGVYGNSGRNIISGPAMSNTDFTLIKDIVLREAMRVQLRGSFSTSSTR